MADTLPEIREILERSGLAFEVMECDPSLADTAVFCEHYGVSLDHSANTIVVKSKTGEEKFAACLVLATMRLDVNKVVRKRLGVRKASFAGAEETKAMTGMDIGGVTALGLPAALPLWVDGEVMRRGYVILGGGNRESKIKVSPKIFETIANTEIVEGLARPPVPPS